MPTRYHCAVPRIATERQQERARRFRIPALSIVFFFSGAAALLFETLWFRQAGLALGNSVWATSLVTSSFMGGLAVGNALAARYGDRLKRLLHSYAILEFIIAASGLGLVLFFPILTPLMAAALRPIAANAAALNLGRLVVSFILLLIPSTAMGATLPLLARAVTSCGMEFGRALGLLYGWNTLGAVAGALAGEMLLIERLGIRGTGAVAAAFNGAAALGAFLLWKSQAFGSVDRDEEPPTAGAGRFQQRERLLLGAAFLCGSILLALEVVWFRFLLLFVFGSSATFAIMLSVVLFGIAAGGILASLWLRWRREATRFLPLIALGAGVVTAYTYATLSALLPGSGKAFMMDHWRVLPAAAYLMLPTAVLSGTLFTFLGKVLKENTAGTTRAAGVLTLSNTAGAMIGALAGGFILLPYAGMELSFLILAIGYAVAAILIAAALWPAGDTARPQLRAYALGVLLFTVLLALFPLGLMRNHYIRIVASRFTTETNRLAAFREGLTETILYLRQELGGEPVFYRLMTNGYSMSGTMMSCQRYMGMFVYLPVALQPEARHALLISYGVGNTARALTETAGLEAIDVVDISRDILEMNRIIRPLGIDPLSDPRVTVHVEDGRFFLLMTGKKYDLITAEPPPPKHAGVVNLYSREHFELIHDRLAEGGIASYWLPVNQLSRNDAWAIIRSFCGAFDDCALWSGYGPEWILIGTRGSARAIDEEAFARQWRDPLVGQRLKSAGIEGPEQLGAAFIADREQLAELTQGIPPVDDDHPHRISPRPAQDLEFFQSMQDTELARSRFAESSFVKTRWPAVLRDRTLRQFGETGPIHRYAWAMYGGRPVGLPELHAALSSSRLRTPVLWLMGAAEQIQQIARRLAARGVMDPGLEEAFGAEAMANRDYLKAEEHYSRAQLWSTQPERIAQWRVLALCMGGKKDEAARIIEAAQFWFEIRDPSGWEWLSQTFSLR